MLVQQLLGTRSPRVDCRVDGMINVDVNADQRLWCSSTSTDSRNVSARYGGAVPWRQQSARAHSRNVILSGTLNQWSSRRSGVTCSFLLTERTPTAQLTAGVARVCQTLQQALCCSSQPCWRPMNESALCMYVLKIYTMAYSVEQELNSTLELLVHVMSSVECSSLHHDYIAALDMLCHRALWVVAFDFWQQHTSCYYTL